MIRKTLLAAIWEFYSYSAPITLLLSTFRRHS